MQTDGQTDMMKLVVASGNFAKVSKTLRWSTGLAAFVLDFGARRK
jgi:hypothetical protein